MAPPTRATAARDDERLVRRFIGEVLVQRRLEVASELFSVDVVDHQAGGVSRGVQRLTEGVRHFLRAFPDLTIALHAMAVAPPITMAWIAWQGTHAEPFMGVPATGHKLTADCVNIFRSEGGRLTERWEYVDVATRFGPPGLPRPASLCPQPPAGDRPLLRIRW